MSPEVRSFFCLGAGPDLRYRYLFENEGGRFDDAVRLIESLWDRAQDYLDADLREQAQHDFFPRFWEMFLTSTLLDAGLKLVPRRERKSGRIGPDLRVVDPLMWIEAVVADRGTGPDAVLEMELGGVRSVPDDQLILRLTNALALKHQKYQSYVANGVIGSSEPFVVAINAALIMDARHEREIPRIVRAVYPFGNLVIQLRGDTFEQTGAYHEHRDAITKGSGAPVQTSSFVCGGLAGVSGILYTCGDEYNTDRLDPGQFVYVHNVTASNPVPRGTFPFGREYWLESKLFEKNWSADTAHADPAG